MSGMKRYAEEISVEMGFQGEINDEVMTEGARRLRAVNIRHALKKLGTEVFTMPSKGLIAIEVSRMIGENVDYEEIEAAIA